MRISVSDYSINKEVSLMFDTLQMEGECCGISDWSDFSDTPWAENSKNLYFMVPHTCCKPETVRMTQDTADYSECMSGNNMELVYKSGCYTIVKEKINASVGDIKVII